MVRITVVAQSPKERLIQIDGWLTQDEGATALLQREGEQAFRRGQRLSLDLSGLRFIDRTGIGLLQKWSGDRLRLCGGSLFVRMLLERHGLSVTPCRPLPS